MKSWQAWVLFIMILLVYGIVGEIELRSYEAAQLPLVVGK